MDFNPVITSLGKSIFTIFAAVEKDVKNNRKFRNSR